MRPRLLALLLVATNLVPLLGVLLLDWRLLEVMLVVWLEGVVITLATCAKIAVRARWLALALVPLYATVMAGALLLQLLLIVLWFFVVPMGQDFWGTLGDLPRLGVALAWAAAALVLAQLVAFVARFLHGPERALPLWRLVLAPSAHAGALQLVVAIAGVFVKDWDVPTLALALLVVLKTGVDAGLFALEELLEKRAPAREEAPAVG